MSSEMNAAGPPEGASAIIHHRPLSARDLEAILDVTKALAAPFDLMTMLGEVVAAAKQVLGAERGSVWLYDEPRGELVLEVATGIQPVRVPWQSGLVGACSSTSPIVTPMRASIRGSTRPPGTGPAAC
jgi:GAF domain-containing protein